MKKLYIDIETKPNICYTWGLFNQNIGLEQIVEPGSTLSFAAKWEIDGRIQRGTIFRSVYHDGHDAMVFKAHELLEDADIIIHYNGVNFDIPILNKEFVKMDMAPPVPYQQIDLLRAVRAKFRFASNKLDFVSQFLGLGAKHPNKGMSLWTGCINGDPDSWRDMKKYNIQDVELLPKLYNRLLPWISNHPNMGLYAIDRDQEKAEMVCTNCGSENISHNGVETLATQQYNRYKCADCGTNLRGRTTILPLGVRKAILTQSKL